MKYWLSIVCIACLAAQSFASVSIEKIGDTVVDPAALNLGDPHYKSSKFAVFINGCTGQQEALVTHQGFQYVTYYDADRHVCLARRELPADDWQVIRLTDYLFKSNDGHNYISFGICPRDGTIHIAFDHHGSPLHYRVSKNDAANHPQQTPWDASLFGPVHSDLQPGKPIRSVTYPRFFATPEGALQLTYRIGGSGGGHMFMDSYDPATGLWSDHHQIDSGEGKYAEPSGFRSDDNRCSYPNGYTYDAHDRLHVSWVWRETNKANTNHDLMYAYSDDQGKTWINDAGQPIDGVPSIHTPGITVLVIPCNSGLANGNCQAIDSQGRIHVILRHYADVVPQGFPRPTDTVHTPSKHRPSAYFHYWRKGPGQWEMNKLPVPGASRCKIFLDKADNAIMIAQVGGDLRILAATAAKQWTDWQLIQTEKGPFNNEMLADPVRWKDNGILSVFTQARPTEGYQPSPLRIIDFKIQSAP